MPKGGQTCSNQAETSKNKNSEKKEQVDDSLGIYVDF